jgi:hypothetical protein
MNAHHAVNNLPSQLPARSYYRVNEAFESGIIKSMAKVGQYGAGSYTYFSYIELIFLPHVRDGSADIAFNDKSCRNRPKLRRNKYEIQFVVQNSNCAS